MSTYTRDNTDLAVDLGDLGQQHRAEAGGMLVALERWQAGLDTGEMFNRPGHNAHVDEDVELVEFTRADETPGINNLEQ